MSAHLRAERLMTESIDFGLTPAEQAEMDDHLATCPVCRARSVAYRSDAADLRHIAFVEPPARGRWSVIEGVGGRRSRSWQPWQVLAAAALVIMTLFGVAVAMGALDQRQPRLGVAPTDRPSANPIASSRAPASTAVGLTVRCGPLEATRSRCLQLVGHAAGGLSSEFPQQKTTSIAVDLGTIQSWCAPPQPCISAPPDSYWVTFTTPDGWERIPAYAKGDAWILGVPVAEDASAGTDGPTPSASAG